MRSRRLSELTVSAALVLLAGAAAAQDRAGDLDLSFNGTGWMKVRPNGSAASSFGLAVQPDGKFVMAGHGASALMAVWRLNPDGSPDASFNGTGTVSVGGIPGAASVALRSDGRIFAGSSSGGKIFVAAFLPDGRPDNSFGPLGRAISPFSGTASKILVQPDNKILVANDTFSDGSVVRFLPTGVPDAGFGSGGRVLFPFRCSCLALQSDGKIIAGINNGQFFIRRLLPNGHADPDFGENGTALLDAVYAPLPAVTPKSITVTGDGKILVAGDFRNTGSGPPDFALARLLPEGSPDPAFGDAATPGLVLASFNASLVYAAALAVQDDGRLLVAGMAMTGGDMNVALARFTAPGVLDPSFGTGGRIVHDMDNNSYDDVEEALLLPGGKLLVGGYTHAPGQSPDASLLLARFITTPGTVLSAESPAGLPLSADPVDFGTVTIGTRITGIVLRNHNAFTLTNLQAALTDESHPGEYHVTLPPGAASLAPGATLAATLSLTPAPSAAPGLRTASVRFTAANGGLPPLVVSLTGAKATALQIWRYTWFGSPDDSGAGADLNDFDHDGLPNFMEYATLTHPHQYSAYPCQPAGAASFTYTRPAAALTEFSYTPESAPSPDGPWSPAGLTTTILTDSGAGQTVQVTAAGALAPRLFLRLRVTKL